MDEGQQLVEKIGFHGKVFIKFCRILLHMNYQTAVFPELLSFLINLV